MLTGFNIENSDKYADQERERDYSNTMDLITDKGREQVLHKISELQKRKPMIAEQIAAARDNGGVEENEELHMALEEMQRVDVEIIRLSEIIDKSNTLNIPQSGEYDIVRPGMTVEIENFNTEKVMTYTILGEFESDPSQGSISYKSPLGKELLNMRVGDCIELQRGADIIEYEILRIFAK
jgi:transcription elongation factor GreA